MNYTDEVKKIGLSMADEALVFVTPDGIIEKTGELVDTAFDKDMTGAEKFEWVLDQIKPLLGWLIRNFAEKLVQLMYEILVEKRNAAGN